MQGNYTCRFKDSILGEESQTTDAQGHRDLADLAIPEEKELEAIVKLGKPPCFKTRYQLPSASRATTFRARSSDSNGNAWRSLLTRSVPTRMSVRPVTR